MHRANFSVGLFEDALGRVPRSGRSQIDEDKMVTAFFLDNPVAMEGHAGL